MDQAGRKLRTGYTTGTCAAAAAMAAALAFLRLSETSGDGKEGSLFVPAVTVSTPDGTSLTLGIADCGVRSDGSAFCAVKKDSGDDPDITNGVLVYAEVRGGCPDVGAEDAAVTPAYTDPACPGVYLSGGEGIGTATKAGLQVPVGYPAINPVPRRQIIRTVYDILKESHEKGKTSGTMPVTVTISIPGGKELAQKTFNPRLGIEGGLSVLGTTGIVRPMSEDALIETIRLDIRVKAAGGRKLLAAAPGNYGAAFLKERFGLEAEEFVTCSNYVGETFRMLREEGIHEVLFAGHMGKLIKVAGGILNTHSKYGDHRMEITADCAKEAGASEALQAKLLGMNTTDEAAECLKAEGILHEVLQIAAERIRKILNAGYEIPAEVIIFTGKGDMGMTAGAAALAERISRSGMKAVMKNNEEYLKT